MPPKIYSTMLCSPQAAPKFVCLDYDRKSVIYAWFLISNTCKVPIMPRLKQEEHQMSSTVEPCLLYCSFLAI